MIHPTAIIDPTAEIGKEVSIGPYSVIGAGVTLGDRCEVGPHAVISGPSSFGQENRFFQFCSVGEKPQDLKYHGEPTTLEVGDRNVFRECCTIHRGTIGGGGQTVIGNDNLFMAYTHVAHDCIIGDHVIFSNNASIAGHVTIGDHAILGGFTSVHQFAAIGRHAFSGMGSVITSDVPPFSTVAGQRARVVGLNKEGLARRGFSDALIRALHKSFRVLLKSRQSREDALQELQELLDTYPEVVEFVDFVSQSKRGIAR